MAHRAGVFVPGHDYIRSEIQHRPVGGDAYGLYTNYGAKVLTRFSERHQSVLNIPTGGHVRDPKLADLIGYQRICATLPSLLSSIGEGARALRTRGFNPLTLTGVFSATLTG